MSRPARAPSPFAAPAPPRERIRRACVAVVVASLVTLLPVVATVPYLPPFGLMMLLAWRLRVPGLLPAWAPLPLGLFDDLVSGQPFASAMVLWTLAVIVIDIVDSRLVWRFFAHDWGIAVAAVAATLLVQRYLAAPIAAPVDTLVLLQVATAAALFPLVALIVARVDPGPPA